MINSLALVNEQEWINEQLSIHGVINCAYSDETLLKAFKALFGNEWKRTWNDASKIQEMKKVNYLVQKMHYKMN